MELDNACATALIVFGKPIAESPGKVHYPMGLYNYLDDPERVKTIWRVDNLTELARCIRFAREPCDDPEKVDSYGISLWDVVHGFNVDNLEICILVLRYFDVWKEPFGLLNYVSWELLCARITGHLPSTSHDLSAWDCGDRFECRKNRYYFGQEPFVHMGAISVGMDLWLLTLDAISAKISPSVIKVKNGFVKITSFVEFEMLHVSISAKLHGKRFIKCGTFPLHNTMLYNIGLLLEDYVRDADGFATRFAKYGGKSEEETTQ
jgi:hypothetical protein